jgi:hypothetical protein
MRNLAEQLSGHLRPVAKPPAVIFGVALLHFVATCVWVTQWRQEFGGNPYILDWDPGVLLIEPFLLLFSAGILMLRTWWSRMVSLLVALWLLNSLAVGGLLAVSKAHGLPLLSTEAVRRWVQSTWLMQSQVFIQLALAGAITIYAVIASYGAWWRRRRDATHGI